MSDIFAVIGFEITLRDVSPKVLPIIEKEMGRLGTEGLPNRFGKQRFGNKHDTHLIGKALVKGEWRKALGYVLSDETAQFSELAKRVEREKEQGSLEKVVTSIPHRLRKLYLSAYQASLFNAILEKRLPNLGKLLDGDIAVKHINGAPFLVENATVEQPRADAFEISPSGPIFGYKMRQPAGAVQTLELSLLAEEGVKPAVFAKWQEFGYRGHADPYACRWNCIRLWLQKWDYASVLHYLQVDMQRWF